jgi:hypothetical protein
MSIANIIHKRLEVRSRGFRDWRTQSLRESYEALPNGCWLRNELHTILTIRAPTPLSPRTSNSFWSRT